MVEAERGDEAFEAEESLPPLGVQDQEKVEEGEEKEEEPSMPPGAEGVSLQTLSLGASVGPYSFFGGLGSLIIPFKPEKGTLFIPRLLLGLVLQPNGQELALASLRRGRNLSSKCIKALLTCLCTFRDIHSDL